MHSSCVGFPLTTGNNDAAKRRQRCELTLPSESACLGSPFNIRKTLTTISPLSPWQYHLDTTLTTPKHQAPRTTGSSSDDTATPGKRAERGPRQGQREKPGGWRGLNASSLGKFVEIFEVQVAVVAMIYLDLVASTTQLLSYMKSGAINGGSGQDGGGDEKGSTGASVFRLFIRLMEVRMRMARCDEQRLLGHRIAPFRYKRCGSPLQKYFEKPRINTSTRPIIRYLKQRMHDCHAKLDPPRYPSLTSPAHAKNEFSIKHRANQPRFGVTGVEPICQSFKRRAVQFHAQHAFCALVHTSTMPIKIS